MKRRTAMFQDNLNQVRERIREACSRAGRNPEEVRILPVSKTVGPDGVREAAGCGLLFFGESRVQEARQKIPLCPSNLQWHFIGHLQTNKVRDAVRLFSMIHSVDSARLLTAIESSCAAIGSTMRVCLQVNNSGESSKFGAKPDEVPGLLEAASRLPHVEVVGLMAIPPQSRDPEDARPFFRALRELRDQCRAATGFALPDLSMGMSQDFEVAVEEGATWVRLGTVLFGRRGEEGGRKGESGAA